MYIKLYTMGNKRAHIPMCALLLLIVKNLIRNCSSRNNILAPMILFVPPTAQNKMPSKNKCFYNTVKPVLSGHSKIDKTEVLKTDGSLMQVESIAKCSL